MSGKFWSQTFWNRSSRWSPVSISSLIGWWDFSDTATVTLNGSNISGVTDKSTAGRNLSQSTGALQPAYESSTALRFSDAVSGMYMDMSSTASVAEMVAVYSDPITTSLIYFLGSTPRTRDIFVNIPTNSVSIDGTSGTASGDIYINRTTLEPNTGLGINVTPSPAFPTTAGQKNIFGVKHNTTYNYNRVGVSASQTQYGWRLYEMLIFNANLSTTDRSTVCTYLDNKWNTNFS